MKVRWHAAEDVLSRGGRALNVDEGGRWARAALEPGGEGLPVVSSTVCWGVGGENLLQHHGNLPTEPWQHAALLSQVAQHLLNNLGLCLTFPGKVPRQLPCPHSTDLAGLQLC